MELSEFYNDFYEFFPRIHGRKSISGDELYGGGIFAFVMPKDDDLMTGLLAFDASSNKCTWAVTEAKEYFDVTLSELSKYPILFEATDIEKTFALMKMAQHRLKEMRDSGCDKDGVSCKDIKELMVSVMNKLLA